MGLIGYTQDRYYHIASRAEALAKQGSSLGRSLDTGRMNNQCACAGLSS